MGRRVAGYDALFQLGSLRQVQEAVAKDPEFAQVQADGMKIAELHGRRIKKAAANHAPQKNPFFLSWQVIFADLWNRSIL